MQASPQCTGCALWRWFSDQEHMLHTDSATSFPPGFRERQEVTLHPPPLAGGSQTGFQEGSIRVCMCTELIQLHKVYFPLIYIVYYFRKIILHCCLNSTKPLQAASALVCSVSSKQLIWQRCSRFATAWLADRRWPCWAHRQAQFVTSAWVEIGWKVLQAENDLSRHFWWLSAILAVQAAFYNRHMSAVTHYLWLTRRRCLHGSICRRDGVPPHYIGFTTKTHDERFDEHEQESHHFMPDTYLRSAIDMEHFCFPKCLTIARPSRHVPEDASSF